MKWEKDHTILVEAFVALHALGKVSIYRAVRVLHFHLGLYHTPQAIYSKFQRERKFVRIV